MREVLSAGSKLLLQNDMMVAVASGCRTLGSVAAAKQCKDGPFLIFYVYLWKPLEVEKILTHKITSEI